MKDFDWARLGCYQITSLRFERVSTGIVIDCVTFDSTLLFRFVSFFFRQKKKKNTHQSPPAAFEPFRRSLVFC